MSHRHNIQPDLQLVTVVYTGVISPAEEAEGLEAVIADERLRPDFRFLVDRSGSEMMANPADVPPVIALVQQHQQALGTPKIAVVAGAQYDFGMLRLFEMTAEDKIDHNFWVFRTVEQACDWLGVSVADVVWPAQE